MLGAKYIFSCPSDLFYFTNSSSKWVVMLFIFLVTVYCVMSFSRRRYKLPPGPTGIPFFGYIPFLRDPAHKTLSKLAKKYGPIFSFNLGQSRVIILNDWVSVKDAMSQNATLDRPHELNDLPSGMGFIRVSGKEWFEQRRFSMKIMKDVGLGRAKWEEMLEEEVDDIVRRIEELKGQPVDCLKVFTSTFTNNILSLIFGERLPSDHKDTMYISEMVDLTLHSIRPLSLSNFQPRFCQLLNAVGLYGSKQDDRKLREYERFLRDCINKRLQRQGDDEDFFLKKYKEEMQTKIKNGEKTTLTEGSLHANAGVLITGGSETTRTSMLWLLLAIAQNPEIQAKVQQELDSVLGKDGTFKWADRTKVPFTFACVLEAQRWRTIVPIFLMRAVNQDTKIGGYDAPKGTFLAVNAWALHNDTKYWPNPEKFDPKAMLLEEGTQINFRPESYNAFSYGRRNCPGETIALMEILAYFSKILQKFNVLPEEGTYVKHDVTMGLTHQPSNFKLRFVPRE